MEKFILKKDKYKKARGGKSRIFEINCCNCKKHICYYQKDGPGLLKRMYLDRILGYKRVGKEFICESCGAKLATLIIYEKENRLAYKLFLGKVNKRIIKA